MKSAKGKRRQPTQAGHDSRDELSESERHYRSLFEAMTEGFALHEIVTDPQGKPCDYIFLDVNPAFERLTGLKREDVIGRGVSAVLPHIDSHWIDNFGKVALTGEPAHLEDFSTPLNRWYEVYAYSPGPRQVAAVFADVTERRNAVDALKRYDLLAEHSRDIILLIRCDDGRILEANTAACRAYGYSRDELLARRIQDLRAEECRTDTARQLEEVDVRGTLFQTTHLRKDGSTFPVEVSSRGATLNNSRMLINVVRDISERRQTEDRIRAIAEFPQDNPNPVMRLAENGAVLYANRPAQSFLKHAPRAPGEVLPTNLSDAVRRVLADGRNEEIDIPGANGTVCSFVLAPSAGGRHVNLYGRDVTRRKIVEAELRQSQTDLNRAQAVAHTGSWRLDVQRNVLVWSEENHRIFGLPQGTLLTYETFLNTVHPDDRALVKEKWAAALRGEPYDIEHRIVVDGSTKWVREKAELEFDHQGVLLGGFGTTQDVTELKRAAEALREANENLEARVKHRTAQLHEANEAIEQEMAQRQLAQEQLLAERKRFKDVLETLPVFLILLTPDHQIPFANRVFRERFGSPEKRCYDHLFARNAPCDSCQTYTVIDTGRPHQWQWNGPDNRTYQLYNFPFTDADGSPLILEMGIDITERKQYEQELHSHREHLEDVVRSRIAELERGNAQLAAEIAERERVEEALRQNQTILERSNKDLEQFAYVASHDLQEPLRQISGFVRLLQRDYEPLFDAKACEFFAFITDATTRMQSLIRDLLDYARIGQNTSVYSKVELKDALDAAIRNLQARIDETQAHLSVNPLPVVQGNITLLAQVFQNLIGNSLKFRGEQPVEIEIASSRNDSEWTISIKDNGIGFSKEYAERIFLVFQRLHGRGGYEGTGIGLAICKKIIEHHGGRIWAESAPDEGATFYFTLPAG